MKLDLEYLAEKRRMLWYMYKNLQLDKEFCEACAEEILDTPELLQQVKEKPYLLIECCFTIVDKSKKSVPFFFNEVQRNFIYQLEEHGREKALLHTKGKTTGLHHLDNCNSTSLCNNHGKLFRLYPSRPRGQCSLNLYG